MAEKFRLRLLDCVVMQTVSLGLFAIFLDSCTSFTCISTSIESIVFTPKALAFITIMSCLIIFLYPVKVTAEGISLSKFKYMNWKDIGEVKIKKYLWLRYLILIPINTNEQSLYVPLWINNRFKFERVVLELSGDKAILFKEAFNGNSKNET